MPSILFMADVIGQVTLILVVITFLIEMYYLGISRKEELYLFQSLWLTIWNIKNTSEGHIIEKDKRGHQPSYDIADLDINYYLIHINNKVRKEGNHKTRPTIPLKWYLSEIHKKIRNINELRANGNPDLWRRDKERKYKYHNHLNRLVKCAEEELRRFIHKTTLKKITSWIEIAEKNFRETSV